MVQELHFQMLIKFSVRWSSLNGPGATFSNAYKIQCEVVPLCK